MYAVERACGSRSPIDGGAKAERPDSRCGGGDITPHPVLRETTPHVITVESHSSVNKTQHCFFLLLYIHIYIVLHKFWYFVFTQN